jgi:hypothetical protein
VRSLLPALILVFSASAQAIPRLYLPDDVAGARSIGMGDAFRGVGTNNDAIVENPAALVISPHYEIAGFFAWDTASPAAFWNASIVDATTLPLALGLSYTHVGSGTGSPAAELSDPLDFGRYVGSSARLALAYPISDVLSIGINADWLLYAGDLAQNAGYAQTSAITGSAAIALHPTPQLTIAGIGYNLIPVGLASELAPRRFALGASYGSDSTFRLDVDGVGTWTNFPLQTTALDVHVGGEFFVAGALAIRAGYFYSGLTETNFGSLGLGLVVPGFAVDVGYRQSLGNTWNGQNWSDHLIVADLKFFLPG